MDGINIALLNDIVGEIGEEKTKELLSDFSCPLNPDVEIFFRDKSIYFGKQGLAQTHIVLMSYKNEPVIVGYYALASKSIEIPKRIVPSATWRKRIAKFATYDSFTSSYKLPIPLIAQLGKNYKNGHNTLITGDILLKLACDSVKEAQRVIGGKMAYLECENIDALKQFYTRNGFFEFGERELDRDEIGLVKTKTLIQMFKYLH